MKRLNAWVTYLQVAPLARVFLLFLVVPIVTIVVVSFFDYTSTQIVPAFILQNYEELLFSPVTWRTYLQTIQFSLITWALTLLIGFTVAYFMAFHVRSPGVQTVLFLLCTIPFWTSNVIRMISWIPFLGRNGLASGRLGTVSPDFTRSAGDIVSAERCSIFANCAASSSPAPFSATVICSIVTSLCCNFLYVKKKCSISLIVCLFTSTRSWT